MCPPNFDPHPVTHVCGGDVCNPEISTSCPDPEICEKTVIFSEMILREHKAFWSLITLKYKEVPR